MSDRAGYLNMPQAEITSEPQVSSFARKDGSVIAVIDLGGFTVHVENVAGGLAVAAAFARAADLISAAEGGQS